MSRSVAPAAPDTDVTPREQPHDNPVATRPDDPAPSDRPAYLAFVAHEMRNPLSTALWSAELLSRMSPEERGGARGEKLAGMCLRTLGRLRHLVEDHFLSERLAIGGIPVRSEPTPVAQALAVAAGRCGVTPAEVQVDGLIVNCDRAMLERTLEALLAFAARGEAPVKITGHVEDGAVEVAVRGAPPPDHAFRMPDRSTLSDPSGRALGLLAARAVAEAHGGSLDLRDDGFVLSLPTDDGASARGNGR